MKDNSCFLFSGRFTGMLLAVFAVFCMGVNPAAAQQVQAVGLRCEYRTRPEGVETAAPALSWKLISQQKNCFQTAFRVLVADNQVSLQKNIGNVWDSKKTLSSASVQVNYSGKPLLASKSYFWKVMVWDNKGQASPWSDASFWQMGLLTPADWKDANWIAFEKLADSNVNVLPVDGKPDKYTGSNVLPLIRKGFDIVKPVKKASLFISGLGHFDASLNGAKIGDHFLDPGWTKYDKEAQYVTFDVTGLLKSGENALGVMLGNGFYYVPPVKARYRKLKSAFGYPKMICRLLVEYQDGTSQNIVSNESWKTAAGPVTFSSIYGGEDYNANLEQPGWDAPGFKDVQWKQALVVDGPSLHSQMQEPLKIFDTFLPKSIKKNQSAKWVYDLGQNASGIVNIRVKGKRGDTIKIVPAELLKADGNVNQRPGGSPFYFTYILKGDGIETWQPRFTYYGFRYVQIEGAVPEREENGAKLPEVIALSGLHMRNAAAQTGNFSSSNTLFNRTDTLITWAVKSNMVSVLTDCPHREKLGWLEQVHLMGSSVRYQFDIRNLLMKTIADMRNSQTEEGLIPEIAPEYVHFTWGGEMFRDSPEWGSSGILVPWYMYQWYGDKKVLADNYLMMQRYVNYLDKKSPGHILSQGLGDWYDLGPNPPGVSQLTPKGVTGTAMFYYDLTIMSQIAGMLGKSADAANYRKLAEAVKIAFNQKFFNAETKQYATGSQAANAMAVYMKLVDPKYKAAVVNNIVKDIRGRNNALTAGDIGYRYLLRVLEEAGRSDVIYEMNNRSDVPGYGYQLDKGATALTESWAALPTVSNNHFMLGHLMEWFYSGLAGIRPAAGSVAFNRIDVKPEVVGDVNSARADHESPYGTIASAWKNDASKFELRVDIPANTKATVYLPAVSGNTILQDGKRVNATLAGGRASIRIGSGTYTFTVNKK